MARHSEIEPGLSAAVDAALRLAKILLERAATHRSGYGYAQTWDASQVGLIEGGFDHWKLTPLGQAILTMEFDEEKPEVIKR